MNRFFLPLVFAIGLFTACESQVEIRVHCYDKETREPIPGVDVQINAGLDGDYTKSTDSGRTDSLGYFETAIMIGCPGKCYDIYITYSKAGYTTKKDLNLTTGDVFLERAL